MVELQRILSVLVSQGRIERITPQAARNFGLSPGVDAAEFLSSLLGSDWRKKLEDGPQSALLPDGSSCIVSGTELQTSQGDGGILLTIVATPSPLAEEALRYSEQRYQQLFSNLNTGFALHEILTDAQGTPVDYRFLEVNPAFERLTGLRAADVIGKRVLEVLPGTEKYWIRRFGKVALSGQPHIFEDFAQELDRWYETLAFSPQARQFAVLFSDITPRKRIEKEREALLRELERKSVDWESIVYALSHDLRSPLVNLFGFSQELKNALEEFRSASEERRIALLDQDISESLNYITASVTRMDRLQAGMLRLSRLGSASVEIQATDVYKVCRDVLNAMQHQLRTSGMEVQLNPLLPCQADSAHLAQIFANLLDNAYKYGRSGVPVRVCISSARVGTQVEYCVEDNGRGIRSEQRIKIFELFHRLDPRSDVPGDGVGLTLVRRLLERMGGDIAVDHNPTGPGTVFLLRLPA